MTNEKVYAVYETTFQAVAQAAHLSDGMFLLEIARGIAQRAAPAPERKAALRAYCDAVAGLPMRSPRHLVATLR
jgi:hypothetical protein